jgi:hypothetical protein
MSNDTSLLWELVTTARVPHAPTVAMGEVHPSLVGHHSSGELFAHCYRGLWSVDTEVFAHCYTGLWPVASGTPQ